MLIKFRRVQTICEALPPFGGTKVGLGRKATKPTGYAAIGVLLVYKEGICAPHKNGSYKHNGVELAVQGSSKTDREIPNGHYGNIDKYLGESCYAVAYSYANKSVMQMGLVGTEGALAMEDAHGHDTECVGNRNGEDSHYHGGRTVCIIKNHASSGIVHGAHDEPRHEDAHDHRTSIAYEHAALIAEYIMYKEQEQ